jgi:hypothetical protein
MVVSRHARNGDEHQHVRQKAFHPFTADVLKRWSRSTGLAKHPEPLFQGIVRRHASVVLLARRPVWVEQGLDPHRSASSSTVFTCIAQLSRPSS